MMSMLKSVAQCQGKSPAGGTPPASPTPGLHTTRPRLPGRRDGAPRRHTGALPSPCQPLPFGARHLPCSTASDRDQALEFELLAESLVGPSPQGWMEGRNLPDLRGFYPRPHGSRVFGHTGGRRAFINGCLEATVLGRGRSRWQGSECPPPLLREWPRLAFESGLLPKGISPVRTHELGAAGHHFSGRCFFCRGSSFLASAPASTLLLSFKELPLRAVCPDSLLVAPPGHQAPLC